MTSVLIALDEPFVQMGVRVTIENTDGFEVVGVAETVDQVVPTVAELARIYSFWTLTSNRRTTASSLS